MFRRLLADLVKNRAKTLGLEPEDLKDRVGHDSIVIVKNLSYGLRPMPLYAVEDYLSALQITNPADQDRFRFLSVLTRITEKDQDENPELVGSLSRLIERFDLLTELEQRANAQEKELKRLRKLVERLEQSSNDSEELKRLRRIVQAVRKAVDTLE